MGTRHWGFAPVIIGEPGAKWRKLNAAELKLITEENREQNNEEVMGSELFQRFLLSIGIA